MKPSEALSRLKLGNERFVKDRSLFARTTSDRLKETTESGQNPFAAVLTCSDSRTPPEYIFDQGIGDIFVVRVAGNVCDSIGLGSIELGVKHCGASLVVVLGHRNCGAIAMAVDGEFITDSIDEILEKIIPSVREIREIEPEIDRDTLIDEAAKLNVRNTKEEILKKSDTLAEKEKSGELQILSAYYDIETGKVEWLD